MWNFPSFYWCNVYIPKFLAGTSINNQPHLEKVHYQSDYRGHKRPTITLKLQLILIWQSFYSENIRNIPSTTLPWADSLPEGWYSGLISCSNRFFGLGEGTGVSALARNNSWYTSAPEVAKDLSENWGWKYSFKITNQASKKWSNPIDPVVYVLPQNNSRTQTSSWIHAGTSERNGKQMTSCYGETNG